MSDMPAFPVTSNGFNSMGMTLRDYFAAQAMQAIRGCSHNGSLWTTIVIAEEAYLLADAMLKARRDDV